MRLDRMSLQRPRLSEPSLLQLDAIINSDGHHTVLTDTPDIISGLSWPGAMSRVKRNQLIDRWTGRERALRQNLADASEDVRNARAAGNTEDAPLFYGQDAGLINDLPPVADIVGQIVAQAEGIIISINSNLDTQQP